MVYKILETFNEGLRDWPFSGAQQCLAELLQFLQVLLPFRRSLHLPWGPFEGIKWHKNGVGSVEFENVSSFHGSSRKTICVRVSEQSGLMEKKSEQWLWKKQNDQGCDRSYSADLFANWTLAEKHGYLPAADHGNHVTLSVGFPKSLSSPCMSWLKTINWGIAPFSDTLISQIMQSRSCSVCLFVCFALP